MKKTKNTLYKRKKNRLVNNKKRHNFDEFDESQQIRAPKGAIDKNGNHIGGQWVEAGDILNIQDPEIQKKIEEQSKISKSEMKEALDVFETSLKSFDIDSIGKIMQSFNKYMSGNKPKGKMLILLEKMKKASRLRLKEIIKSSKGKIDDKTKKKLLQEALGIIPPDKSSYIKNLCNAINEKLISKTDGVNLLIAECDSFLHKSETVKKMEEHIKLISFLKANNKDSDEERKLKNYILTLLKEKYANITEDSSEMHIEKDHHLDKLIEGTKTSLDNTKSPKKRVKVDKTSSSDIIHVSKNMSVFNIVDAAINSMLKGNISDEDIKEYTSAILKFYIDNEGDDIQLRKLKELSKKNGRGTLDISSNDDDNTRLIKLLLANRISKKLKTVNEDYGTKFYNDFLTNNKAYLKSIINDSKDNPALRFCIEHEIETEDITGKNSSEAKNISKIQSIESSKKKGKLILADLKQMEYSLSVISKKGAPDKLKKIKKAKIILENESLPSYIKTMIDDIIKLPDGKRGSKSYDAKRSLKRMSEDNSSTTKQKRAEKILEALSILYNIDGKHKEYLKINEANSEIQNIGSNIASDIEEEGITEDNIEPLKKILNYLESPKDIWEIYTSSKEYGIDLSDPIFKITWEKAAIFPRDDDNVIQNKEEIISELKEETIGYLKKYLKGKSKTENGDIDLSSEDIDNIITRIPKLDEDLLSEIKKVINPLSSTSKSDLISKLFEHTFNNPIGFTHSYFKYEFSKDSLGGDFELKNLTKVYDEQSKYIQIFSSQFPELSGTLIEKSKKIINELLNSDKLTSYGNAEDIPPKTLKNIVSSLYNLSKSSSNDNDKRKANDLLNRIKETAKSSSKFNENLSALRFLYAFQESVTDEVRTDEDKKFIDELFNNIKKSVGGNTVSLSCVEEQYALQKYLKQDQQAFEDFGGKPWGKNLFINKYLYDDSEHWTDPIVSQTGSRTETRQIWNSFKESSSESDRLQRKQEYEEHIKRTIPEVDYNMRPCPFKMKFSREISPGELSAAIGIDTSLLTVLIHSIRNYQKEINALRKSKGEGDPEVLQMTSAINELVKNGIQSNPNSNWTNPAFQSITSANTSVFARDIVLKYNVEPGTDILFCGDNPKEFESVLGRDCKISIDPENIEWDGERLVIQANVTKGDRRDINGIIANHDKQAPNYDPTKTPKPLDDDHRRLNAYSTASDLLKLRKITDKDQIDIIKKYIEYMSKLIKEKNGPNTQIDSLSSTSASDSSNPELDRLIIKYNNIKRKYELLWKLKALRKKYRR